MTVLPELDAIDTILDRFEEVWQQGMPPAIADFLPPIAGDHRAGLLVELILIDLEYRWRRGEQRRIDDYLRDHPELNSQGPRLLDLAVGEYRVRHRWGDRPGHAEIAERFSIPGLVEALEQVDRDLATEYARPSVHPQAPSAAVSSPAATPVTVSVTRLVDQVAYFRLLGPAQLDELIHEMQPRFTDAIGLARELLRRDWLTPYQVNQLFQSEEPDLLLGPYLLLERLGEGGTGWVFKGRHQHMRRLVALKVLRRELLADAEVLSRFYREIQVISQLSHRHVVHAYDAGPIGRSHVLVMEYAPGTDLRRLVKQHGPLDVARACECIRQTALGLQHIHDRGLVHRDIKPSNLLLASVGRNHPEETSGGCEPSDPPRSTGIVKILDLGLSRLGRVEGTRMSRLVLQGGSSAQLTPDGAVVVGTPDYLAPEQALDFHRADHRADIYSLGCTFHYLLTGQPPFPGGTLGEKLIRHQQADPPSIRAIRSDVPEEIDELIRRMLAKDPADRIATAAEVAVILGGGTEPAPGEIHPGMDPVSTELRELDAAGTIHVPSLPRGDDACPSVTGEEELSPPLPARRGSVLNPPERQWLVLSGSGAAAVVLCLLVAWLFSGPAEPPAAIVVPRPPAIPTAPALPGVNFPRGFAEAGGKLTLNGSAIVHGAHIRLTRGQRAEAGSAFTTSKVRITEFASQFSFQLLNPKGDGFTFTIQGINPSALGGTGGGLGYGPDPSVAGQPAIGSSVAIKFDLYNNAGEGKNSTGLFANGETPVGTGIDLTGTGIDLHSSHVFQVSITYDGNLLRVAITDQTTQATARQSYPVNIPRLVGGNTAYVGFTGATGGATSTQLILNWTFTPL